MILRALTVLLAMALVALAIAAHHIKRQTKGMERQVAILEAELAEERRRFAALEVEWHYLNNPVRLKMLYEAQRGIGSLTPLTPEQVLTFEGLKAAAGEDAP